MSDADHSSDEEGQEVDKTPLKVDWLDLSSHGCTADLGITSLPGCRFKDTWRCLKTDVAHLESLGIQDVYTLCTVGELNKYRVPGLLRDYAASETLHVHHYPFPDGQTPTLGTLLKMLEELKAALMQGRKALVHCYGGLGRSCLVAVCLLLQLDPEISVEAAIQMLKDLRGSGAIQSVKQYNFVHEFREKSSEFQASTEGASFRAVSR